MAALDYVVASVGQSYGPEPPDGHGTRRVPPGPMATPGPVATPPKRVGKGLFSTGARADTGVEIYRRVNQRGLYLGTL